MEDISMIMEREAGMRDDVPQVGVGFCLYPLEDQAESEVAGRPIFKDVEFIKIQVPGDRESIYFQPATKDHQRRFPKAYAMFKEHSAIAQQGTPIEQWPAITRGLALTFKAAGIPTVEALAEVHDGNLEKLGHQGRDWRSKARGYLAQSADTAAAQKLEREKQQLLDMIAELRGQIRDLAARLGEDPPAAKPAKAKARSKPRPKLKAA